MGQFYEVQFAKRLDGTDNYGNVTDSIKFTTEEQSALFKHQPQTVVEQGTKLFGRIEEMTGRSGKPYRKFVREQQEGFSQGSGNVTSPAKAVQGAAYASSKNNDGMRQGMCINNAVNIITAAVKSGLYTDLSPEKIGKDVLTYARVLYAIDLSEPEQPAQDTVVEPTEEEMQNGLQLDDIDAMFASPTTNPGSDPR